LLAQLLQPPLRSQAVQQLSGLHLFAFGRRRERLRQLLVADADAFGLHERRQHRFAAQRALGVGLHLSEELLLLARRDLEIGLARDAAVRERVQDALPHLSRARTDELRRELQLRLRRQRIQRGSAELGLDLDLLLLEQAAAHILAQLREAVEAGVDREVL